MRNIVLDAYRGAVRTAPPIDRLGETVREWLADERPAFETVAAFERDVARVLTGDLTRKPVKPVSRMPLRATAESRECRICAAVGCSKCEPMARAVLAAKRSSWGS